MSRTHKLNPQIQRLEKAIKKQIGELGLGSDVKIHLGDLRQGRGSQFFLGYKNKEADNESGDKAQELVDYLIGIVHSNYRNIAIGREYDPGARLCKQVLTLHNPDTHSNDEAETAHELGSKLLKELKEYGDKKSSNKR